MSTPHPGIPAPLLLLFHVFPGIGEEDILLMTGTDPQRRSQSRPRSWRDTSAGEAPLGTPEREVSTTVRPRREADGFRTRLKWIEGPVSHRSDFGKEFWAGGFNSDGSN